MKTILSILIIFLPMVSQAQNFDTALDYLDFIKEEQEDISKRMWKYTKAIAHSRNDRKIERRRERLIKTIDKAIKNIENAPGFDGEHFKSQVLNRLVLNRNLLNDEYDKIIDMKEISEQSYDAMEAYMKAQELADKKMEKVQNEYESNLYKFANKHNINIVEGDSDLGKKMAKSNEVFKYYKAIYLVYFKVYVNEIYLMEALNANDINGIQQNANALSSSAEEGLKILDTLSAYDRDKSLISTTRKSFEFFQDEADEKMPILIDFLLLSEDMQKSQKAIEDTPKRKRTKKQVEDFNNLVNNYNKSVQTY
ncbi:MAG: hypothetical protein KGY51_11925, partial [Psychroflexus sp.]|nr:hypothetical protein [Psychroflexus sp.]